MQHEVIFAGFGGQGILLIGQMVAYAGMDEGKNVTWLPSYGPEMRGGTASCTVVVSDKPIGSPVISSPEIVVVMNRPSLEKFGPQVRKDGYLFINSSMIDVRSGRNDIKEILVPCNDLAAKVGNPRSANIVMLGALIKKTEIISEAAIRGRIEYAFKKKGTDLIKLNNTALDEGAKTTLKQ
jgi:2-oxoglutarate ferredoxin oxidoreductase subunit gamma